MTNYVVKLAVVAVFVCCTSHASASIALPPIGELGQFLFTGMKKSANGDAVNIQNTEIGADRAVLSERWLSGESIDWFAPSLDSV